MPISGPRPGQGIRLPSLSLGGAYQFAPTDRRSIFRQRFTANVTLELQPRSPSRAARIDPGVDFFPGAATLPAFADGAANSGVPPVPDPRTARSGLNQGSWNMTDIRFENRVAVITGAGGGLGKTYALELARRGAKVVVNDLGGKSDGTGAGHSMADATVKEIQEKGGTAIANYDSVSTPEGGEAIVRSALDAFGRVDIVINNAGVLRDKTFAKLTPEELNLVLEVHLKGAFFVSQPAFRAMKEQNYGRIVFTASAAGIFGNFGQTNYGAAKMGLVGLCHVLALEGMKNNIKCNVIAPIAKTRMTEQLLGPLAEHVKPELVTPLVVYLCSEQCPTTHEIYSVGGGRYARIFVGLVPGWYAGKGVVPSAEDVAGHFDQIRQPEGYIIPDNLGDEMKLLLKSLQG